MITETIKTIPNAPKFEKGSKEELSWMAIQLGILNLIPYEMLTADQREWGNYIVFRLNGGYLQ